MHFKKPLLLAFIFISAFASAQKVENIFVNLYTDSLKKGTYNYINVDGQLSNGNYLPLDSTSITFWASAGKFYGNSLWLDKDFKNDSVFIKVMLKGSTKVSKEFTIYVKKKPDNEKLKSADEILSEMDNKSNKRKKG